MKFLDDFKKIHDLEIPNLKFRRSRKFANITNEKFELLILIFESKMKNFEVISNNSWSKCIKLYSKLTKEAY